MTALTQVNVVSLYSQGGPDLLNLFALRNVTTGDTIDVATVSSPAFQVVKLAIVLSVAAGMAELCPIAGTVVTMPAKLAASSGYLVVSGC